MIRRPQLITLIVCLCASLHTRWVSGCCLRAFCRRQLQDGSACLIHVERSLATDRSCAGDDVAELRQFELKLSLLAEPLLQQLPPPQQPPPPSFGGISRRALIESILGEVHTGKFIYLYLPSHVHPIDAGMFLCRCVIRQLAPSPLSRRLVWRHAQAALRNRLLWWATQATVGNRRVLLMQ